MEKYLIKYLKYFKDKQPEVIKANIYSSGEELLSLLSKDAKHFLYYAPLILAFADERGSEEEFFLLNGINSHFLLGHPSLFVSSGADKVNKKINENLRKFLLFIDKYKTNEFDLNYIESIQDNIAKYVVCVLSYKKVVSEQELSFLGKIFDVDLADKGLSFGVSTPKIEKAPTPPVKKVPPKSSGTGKIKVAPSKPSGSSRMVYRSKPDLYVFPFEIHERNNKVRTIITYRNDENGNALRLLHERYLSSIRRVYRPNKHSFAYHKHISCKNALDDHLKSNAFIKLDISSFFESISLKQFTNECGHLLDNASSVNIDNMFYGNNLSLGFVTSPIVSDMFMHDFDEAIELAIKAKPYLHYSRYCDDILISSEHSDFADLEALEQIIIEQLGKKGLHINTKKRKQVLLDYESHNSLSFLGLNLSKLENGDNKITISKRFILKTLDLLKVYYKNPAKCNMMYKSIILSRIAYIKLNSNTSYKRFMNKHRNMFNKGYNKI